MWHKAYIPKTITERISDTVDFFPKTFNMPYMSYIDATYHAAQYFIYAIHNTSPARPIVKLVNGNKESLKTLV